MLFDYSKLRGKIIEKYGTYSNFAEALGVSKVSVSNKLCNEQGLAHGVIYRWAKVLDIEQDEIGIYFFSPKVQEN